MLRRFVAPIAIAAVMLLLLEGVVRIAFPEIGPLDTDKRLIRDNVYETSSGIAPNTTGISHGSVFSSDEHGFWRYSKPTDPTKPSWLLIGDSVTMGIGVEPDHTFAGLLSAQIDATNILNVSLIGYSVADYARVLRSLLVDRPDFPLEIDRVTVFWCLNDVYADLPAGDPDQTVRRSFGPVLRWVRRHYQTYQWLKAAITDRPRTYYEYDRAYYENNRPYLDRSVELLAQMQGLSEDRDIRFEVVLLPYRHQLTGNDPALLGAQRLLTQRLQDRRVDVHDAAPAMQTDRPERLFRFGDGIHFSPAGHRLVAEWLLNEMR